MEPLRGPADESRWGEQCFREEAPCLAPMCRGQSKYLMRPTTCQHPYFLFLISSTTTLQGVWWKVLLQMRGQIQRGEWPARLDSWATWVKPVFSHCPRDGDRWGWTRWWEQESSCPKELPLKPELGSRLPGSCGRKVMCVWGGCPWSGSPSTASQTHVWACPCC